MIILQTGVLFENGLIANKNVSGPYFGRILLNSKHLLHGRLLIKRKMNIFRARLQLGAKSFGRPSKFIFEDKLRNSSKNFCLSFKDNLKHNLKPGVEVKE